MSRHSTMILGIVAAGAFWASAATGQQPTQSGRALDASLRVGGSRYNSAVPINSQLNSQLYVTGQVTGLGRFHGRVGYRGEDELYMRLPSARLGDFRRRSVGLHDVLGGTAHLVSPYQEPTRTTLKVNDILAGRAGPGTNMPAVRTVSTAGSALRRNLYIDALVDYSSVTGMVSGRALAPALPRGMLNVQPGQYTGPSIRVEFGSGRVVPAAPGAAAPPVADLFAVAGRKDQLDLAQELYREHRRSRMIDAAVVAKVSAAASGTDPVTGTEPGTDPDGKSPTDENRTPGGPIEGPGSPGGIGQVAAGQPPINQDVYLDMLLRLRQRREQVDAAARAGAGTPTGAKTPGAGERPLVIPKPAMASKDGLVVLSDQNEVILRGLAGRSGDQFNVHMSKASDELRARKFYDAASLYETAGLHDPRNPLARMGMGLSLLGAGESLSAAYQIKRAIGLFPPMMETRVDLSGMMDAKVIETRLNALDRRMRGADRDSKKLLIFLATFLYHNSEQPDKARTYAEQLKASARHDALLKAYAEFVLSGRRPDAGRDKPEKTDRPGPKPGPRAPARPEP